VIYETNHPLGYWAADPNWNQTKHFSGPKLQPTSNRTPAGLIDFSAEEHLYWDTRTPLVEQYNIAYAKLIELGYRPKWGRDDWKAALAEQYDIIISVTERASAMAIPDKFAPMYEADIKAWQTCHDWAEQSRQAVLDET
jgi:hypothetical protein